MSFLLKCAYFAYGFNYNNCITYSLINCNSFVICRFLLTVIVDVKVCVKMCTTNTRLICNDSCDHFIYFIYFLSAVVANHISVCLSVRSNDLPDGACTHAHSAWLNSVLGPHDISTPPKKNFVLDDPELKGQTPTNKATSIINALLRIMHVIE